MKYINKIYLVVVCMIFLNSTKTFAVDVEPKDFRIKIILIDSVTQDPIEFATVSITPEGKKEALKYALTDASGWAEIVKVPEGTYTLKAECLGYLPFETKVNTTGKSLLDLGRVKMKQEINVLSTVTVTALGNPIIVKKDTIEYNASSFKVTDQDMLEALLKKLPGIEVSSDGTITANGKTIDKITIDGKTFFFNDPQLATKNLPAKIIDKVKVLEKKSEQAQFTGIDDGQSETVIDLSIRPGMMNGWFGNVTGGYGTDDKYQVAGMLGNFTSKSQISMIANANNTNNRGFFDVAGDAMRSMRNSLGGAGGVRIGGAVMNFGGSGITTSWMGGVNANTVSNNKKLNIGGSYLYSGSDTENKQVTSKQTFLADSSFIYNSNQYSKSSTDANSASVNLEYKFNDKTSILFRPNMNIGSGSFNEENVYFTKGVLGSSINDGSSKSYGNSDTRSLNGDLLLRQKFNKTGRTFSVNFNYGYSNNDIEAFNESTTNSYGTNPLTTEVRQKYNTEQDNYSLGGRASYTEPLGNHYYMELAYSYNFRKNNSDKVAKNFNQNTGNYDLYDSTYSNSFENTFINQIGELNIRKVEEKYSFTLGMNVQPAYTHSITTSDRKTTDLERSVVNYSPSALLDIDFSDSKSLRIRYRGSTRQPSISQMQPVKDNSNPLFVSEGNPDLLPEFSHNLSLNFRNTNRSNFSTVNARLDGTYTLDKIANKTWYEEGGIQHTKPVNDQAVYSISGNIMWNTPIEKTKKFYFMTNTRAGINNGINYSSSTASETGAVKNITTSLSVSEMLRLAYRGEKLEITAGGRVSYAKAWYTIGETKDATWNNSLNATINWTLPAGFGLASDIEHQFYVGYGEGYNDPATVWNAEVSKLLFKNSASLIFRVFDILDQSKSVRRTTTDNYIQDVSSLTLKQYFMLSFTWRFGKFGDRSGQQGGSRGMNHGRFGPPGGVFHR
ncbi:MAG TPA: outer membrane beta-barrel family protein [Bacteroidales bacterium]|nr:outer membrane beta-barrel family protein [Bacteroidales bacterium]HRT32887.1 outer membrane beta-barrel family protein [Bacteroidales bacterium]HRT84270.1 outer membrane beta-barrel family protein [Bacteroidales bacterium]